MNSQEIARDRVAQSPARTDQRTSSRVSLVIRGAKVICPLGEFLCIIRDVSETGVRLKLFHQLPLASEFALELANGEKLRIVPIWWEADEAGFRSAGKIDVRHFVAEPSAYPKRSLRLKISHRITVCAGATRASAEIRDISRQGALIICDQPLALSQRIVISGNGLPDLDATVRWRNQNAYGIALENIFTFEELALIAASMQLGRIC